jgi:hypothetical protein
MRKMSRQLNRQTEKQKRKERSEVKNKLERIKEEEGKLDEVNDFYIEQKWEDVIKISTELLKQNLMPEVELHVKTFLYESYCNTGNFDQANYDMAAELINDCLLLIEKIDPRLYKLKKDVLTGACYLYHKKGVYKHLLVYAQKFYDLCKRHGEENIMALRYIFLAGIELNDYDLTYSIHTKILDVLGTTDPGKTADIISVMASYQRKLNKWIDAGKSFRDLENLINTNASVISATAGYWEQIGDFYVSFKQYRMASDYIYCAYISHLSDSYKNNKIALESKDQETKDQWTKKAAQSEEEAIRLNGCMIRINSLIINKRSGEIDSGCDFLLCNHCMKISDDMKFCTGCVKAWYCNEECQLADWTKHKPHCYVCQLCDKVLSHIVPFPHCSICKKTYYCGEECQKEHWKDHKDVCCSPTSVRIKIPEQKSE